MTKQFLNVPLADMKLGSSGFFEESLLPMIKSPSSISPIRR